MTGPAVLPGYVRTATDRRGRRGGPRPALGAAGVVVVVATLVTGCGSSPPTSAPTTPPTTGVSTSTGPATTVAATTATTATSTSAPVTAGPPTTPSVATPARCTTRALTGGLSHPNGTAGAVDYLLDLLNTGSVACILQGYPGLSFVAGSDGHQVGAPAGRLSARAPVVLVAPGHGAQARVSVTDANNFPTACKVTAVLGFRIYPPDNTTSLFVPHTDRTCAAPGFKTLGVGPLQG